MNATDQAVTAPTDPIFAAVEARLEWLEAKISTAPDDRERDQIAANIEACKRLLRKLTHLTQTS
jgi:hypothetical protein